MTHGAGLVLECDPGAIADLQAGIDRYGFACAGLAVDDTLLASLAEEAISQRPVADEVTQDGPIAYQARLAQLGDRGRSALSAPSTLAFLRAVLGNKLRLSGGASCYTYYEPGNFLNAHRDDPEQCAATLLLYLEATSPDPSVPDSGLALHVYGCSSDPDERPRTSIPTRAGGLIVGRGASYWHGRLRMRAGERVTAITACYGPRR